MGRTQDWFEVKKSKIQGKGGFALRLIPKGTRIIEYTGELVDDDEATRRYDDSRMKRHHTFLFSLETDLSIDAARGGNEARFINHSCTPNCEAVQEGKRIFIEATKDITPGEELFYDYRYEYDGPIDEETRELYICRCGAASCRGTILFLKKTKPANARRKVKKGKTTSARKKKRTSQSPR